MGRGLMARPRSGNVVRRQTTRGIAYSLRFHGYPLIRLGGDWEGWDEQRVEAERAHIARVIERGEYVAPEKTAPTPSRSQAPTFQVAASTYYARAKVGMAPKSAADLLWRLTAAMDHFGPYPVDQIDARIIDAFTTAAMLEREAIEQAKAAGHPLLETITRKDGATYQARRRGLSNNSINKVIDGVRRVLAEAQRYGQIDVNAAADKAARVKTTTPSRSFLEVVQLELLFEGAAAAERAARGLTWDDVHAIRASADSHMELARRYRVSDTTIRKIRRRELWSTSGERNRHDVPRVPIVVVLALAGLRITELVRLLGADLDFAGRRIKVPRTKTDASVRIVPMLPLLYDVLIEHKAEVGYGAGDPVFATRTGRRQSPDNLRARILRSAHEHANELAARVELAPIAHLTPHTLRRTFASILAEIGVAPRRAMYLLGHTDPSLTMSVYQQVMDASPDAQRRLHTVLGASPDEALQLLSGRGVLATNLQPPTEKALSERLPDLRGW